MDYGKCFIDKYDNKPTNIMFAAARILKIIACFTYFVGNSIIFGD